MIPQRFYVDNGQMTTNKLRIHFIACVSLAILLLLLDSCTSPSPTVVPTVGPSPTHTSIPLVVRTPAPTCLRVEWGEMDPQAFSPMAAKSEEQSFQEYEVRTYYSSPCFSGSFEIMRHGETIYARHGGEFWVGRSWDAENREHFIPMGQDVTGDGLPNLVIMEYTGGVHCCTFYHVFTIGPEFRYIETIIAGDYDSYFTDLDQDGNWEFTVHDWVITPCLYWPCCCGPDPYVILHYSNEDYHLALDLMRKPALAEEDMKQLAREFAELDDPPEQNAEFWDAILDLIYTGHAESVEPFLKLVWPNDQARRNDFIEALLDILSQSLYWPEIKDVGVEWPWSVYGEDF